MQPGYPPPPGGYPPPGYYPPGAYPPPPGYGQPLRTTTPRTLGVLSIIFGSLVAAGNVFGLIAGKQFGTMMNTSNIGRAAFERYVQEIHSVSMALGTVMLVMSLALIYIGIGQRGYKKWAVNASVWWGVAALIFLVVQLVVNLTVVMPAMDRMIDGLPATSARDTVSMMMKFGLVSGLVFYAPFPMILITAFRKRANIDVMDQE